jgi:hypothetical protein
MYNCEPCEAWAAWTWALILNQVFSGFQWILNVEFLPFGISNSFGYYLETGVY